MATTQLLQTRQKKKSSKALVLFPTEITTKQQSVVLVERLLAVSVSCITYMRGLFPESSYGTRYLDDLCLKILRQDKSCLGSLEIVKCNQVNLVNGVCSEDLKQASRALIRKLYLLMQNLGPLPNIVHLTMKLRYYSDVTPEDYQPPGFKKDDSPGDLWFDGDPVHLRVGSVSTDFHLMKVRLTTEKKRMQTVESNVIRNSPTEISHQGLDCDEEEEEGSTKNHPLPVRADLSESGKDKDETHPGWQTEASSFYLQDTGEKKKRTKEMDKMSCSRASQQVSCLNLEYSQEEPTGPNKRKKVSEPEKLILESKK